MTKDELNAYRQQAETIKNLTDCIDDAERATTALRNSKSGDVVEIKIGFTTDVYDVPINDLRQTLLNIFDKAIEDSKARLLQFKL